MPLTVTTITASSLATDPDVPTTEPMNQPDEVARLVEAVSGLEQAVTGIAAILEGARRDAGATAGRGRGEAAGAGRDPRTGQGADQPVAAAAGGVAADRDGDRGGWRCACEGCRAAMTAIDQRRPCEAASRPDSSARGTLHLGRNRSRGGLSGGERWRLAFSRRSVIIRSGRPGITGGGISPTAKSRSLRTIGVE